MSVRENDDLWQLKTGTAALAACVVRALQKSDPNFQDNFLETLDRAYEHCQRQENWTRSDGSPRPVQNILEMIAWTRELLTGWNPVEGQLNPFLKT
jgi:hypothetical protein